MPVVRSPSRTLMREDVRLIKMKYVDDVVIRQRLEKDQVVIVVPARAGGDDGIGRGSSPNGGGQLRLHSIPAVSVAHLGLVQDFEEHAVGIPGSIVLGHRAPEIGKAFDEVVF